MMMMIGKNFGYIMIASLLFCQSILLVMTVNCPMVNGLSVSDTNNIMKNSTKPTGNYTNGTSLVRVKALQTIKSIPQLASQIDSNKGFQVIKGQNLLNNNLTNINGSSSIEPNLTTKEEVQKAEEQANVMLKPYFDKLNQQSTPGAPPLAPTTDVPLQQQQQPMTQGNEANNMT
jgi:hypothetical protein